MLTTLALSALYAAALGASQPPRAIRYPQDESIRAALRAEYAIQRPEGTLQFGMALQRRDWTLGEPVHLRVYVRNDGAAPVSAPVNLVWPHGFELFVACYHVAGAEWGLANHEASIAVLERVLRDFSDSPWAAEARESLPLSRRLAKLARDKDGR